jgi:hypothetical protein
VRESDRSFFRTAWDFVGSAFCGPVEVYEPFYLTSEVRNLPQSS